MFYVQIWTAFSIVNMVIVFMLERKILDNVRGRGGSVTGRDIMVGYLVIALGGPVVTAYSIYMFIRGALR